MSKVSKTVPLGTGLCVHVVNIIVSKSFRQGLNLMLEGLAAKCRHVRHVERQAASRLARAHEMHQGDTHFTGTISPLLISFAAAATRVGVKRLRRPI